MLWSSAEVGAGAGGLWFAQRLSVLREPGLTLPQRSFLCAVPGNGPSVPEEGSDSGGGGEGFQWVCFQFHP